MYIEIKPGKGTKMHLSADGEYRLTVSREFWQMYGFATPCHMEAEAFDAFLRQAGERRALDKGMTLLANRAHSVRELRRKLLTHFDEESTDYAVNRLLELGLLDDRAFAAQLSESLVRRKGLSPAGVRMELIKKGVDREIAQETADALTFEPKDKILELLQTKYLNKLGDEKGRQRTFAALVRLGYAYSDIRHAMEEMDIRLEEEG